MSFMFIVSTLVVAAILFYFYHTRTTADFVSGNELITEIAVLLFLGAVITALFGNLILYSLIKWLAIPVILYIIYLAFTEI